MRKTDVHYRYHIPTEITVQIDTREKCPVKFPCVVRIVHPEDPRKRIPIKVVTQRVKLDYGDYRLAEYPDCCVIERKGGQREIHKNIFNPRDSARQAKSLRKLATCEYPYMLIELSPSKFMRRCREVPDTEALINRFTMVMLKYGLHVLWLPWRGRGKSLSRPLGTFMLHTMIACALKPHWEIYPEVLENGYANAQKKSE